MFLDKNVRELGFKRRRHGLVRIECIPYRGTSLIRKRTPLGPYRRPMLRVLGGSYRHGRFLMDEVPLYMEVAVESNPSFRTLRF